MRKRLFNSGWFAALAAIALTMSAAHARAESWGNLKGKFVLDGTPPTPAKLTVDKDVNVCGKHNLVDESIDIGEKGAIKNIVIYLKTEKPAIHPDYEASAKDEAVLDNKNCRFEPHVLVMRTTQSLVIKNSDPIGHNSKGDPLKSPPFNPIIAAGGSTKQTLAAEETLPVKIGCNIHPWMGAWIVVRSNPYAATTNEKGEFEIKNLPAGKELEFRLWQEKSGYLKDVQYKGGKADTKGIAKIKIVEGENDIGEIKVPLKLLSK